MKKLVENRLFPINRNKGNCTVRSALSLLLFELHILSPWLCPLSRGRNWSAGYSSGKGWQPPQKPQCHFTPVAKGCSSVMLSVSSFPREHIGLVTAPPPRFTAKSLLRSCSLWAAWAHQELCNGPAWKLGNCFFLLEAEASQVLSAFNLLTYVNCLQ